jgi:hypothetical protein
MDMSSRVEFEYVATNLAESRMERILQEACAGTYKRIYAPRVVPEGIRIRSWNR